MGTMLIQEGLKSAECPESWNREHPKIVQKIARDYVNAGAEIVETNTFGASRPKLRQYGLENDTILFNVLGVQNAQQSGARFIAGSIGPTGLIPKPYGDVDPELLHEAFEEQAEILVDSGVDLLIFETMMDLTELSIAVRAARCFSSEIVIAATMPFDKTPRGFFTPMGATPQMAASVLEKEGADIVGSNCGNGTLEMLEIAKVFRTVTNLPLLMQPNAGLPEVIDSSVCYLATPDGFAEEASRLLDLGVKLIGGCCGTQPAHMNKLRQRN
jgi:5-methyltetrahydrofolate--homocysteine methyltransferase